MATYKGISFPDAVAPLARHAASVNDHREALAACLDRDPVHLAAPRERLRARAARYTVYSDIVLPGLDGRAVGALVLEFDLEREATLIFRHPMRGDPVSSPSAIGRIASTAFRNEFEEATVACGSAALRPSWWLWNRTRPGAGGRRRRLSSRP